MRVAVFSDHAWHSAATSLGYEAVNLTPIVHEQRSRPELPRRVNTGRRAYEVLVDQAPDLLIDQNGDGLQYLLAAGNIDPHEQIEFSPGYRAALELTPLHQALGVPLASFFLPGVPIRLADTGPFSEGVDWRALQAESWLKLVADQAQAYELQQLGVPNVLHMPAAAPDAPYETAPVDLTQAPVPIAFVGSTRGECFGGLESMAALAPGLLASAYQHQAEGTTFYDAYHALFRLAEPPRAEDAASVFQQKLEAYLLARRAYLAVCGLTLRDRFVLLLKRQVGDVLRIFGRGWDARHGLSCDLPPQTLTEAFALFRSAVVNIDLPDEGCESGISARAFEIAAAGGFLLSYARPELAEYFEIGRECDAFRNEAELLQKCQYYLSHPQRAAEIARQGQRRALGGHLYSHRLKAICARAGVPRERTSGPAPGRMYFDLGDWVDECRALVASPRVILDCGAFTGTTARQLRAAFPRAEIYSFEPVAANFAELEKAAGELRVHAVRAAVSDFDGMTTINLTVGGQSASLLGYQAEQNPLERYHRVIGGEQVPAVTLDNWCADNRVDPRQVDILKMDIQGAELKALAGARRLLPHVTAVFLEVGFRRFYKDMPLFEDVDRFMRGAGFERRAVYPSPAPSVWGDALYFRVRAAAGAPAVGGGTGVACPGELVPA